MKDLWVAFRDLDVAIQMALIPASLAFLGIFIKGFFDIVIALINKYMSKDKSKEMLLQPKKPNLNYRRAKVYRECGDFQEALKCFEQAKIDCEPDSSERASILFWEGMAHKDIAQYDQAINCFLEALAICYTDSERVKGRSLVCESIAITYWAQGKYDEALTWQHKLLILGKLSTKQRLSKKEKRKWVDKETTYLYAMYLGAKKLKSSIHWSKDNSFGEWLDKQLEEFSKTNSLRVPVPSLLTLPAYPPAQTPRESGSQYNAGSCSEIIHNG